MEFFPESIRYDPSALGPSGEDNIPNFKMFGKFEMTIEDVDKTIEGLKWIISKSPKKAEDITDSDVFVMSIVNPLKDIFTDAKMQMSAALESV